MFKHALPVVVRSFVARMEKLLRGVSLTEHEADYLITQIRARTRG